MKTLQEDLREDELLLNNIWNVAKDTNKTSKENEK